MENETNGKATAALILGILSIVLIWVPIINLILGIIALILGIKGLKKSKEQQENGKGLSIAGIIMGSITIVGGLIFVMIAVIASFGVLNTSEMIPEKTTFGVPFISLDTAALNKNDGTIKVAFRNGKGNPIELITATNSGNVNLNQGTCDLAQISTDKTNVNNGETFVITWTCNDPGDIGDKISGDFSFSYKNTNTDITTEHKGKIYSSW